MDQTGTEQDRTERNRMEVEFARKLRARINLAKAEEASMLRQIEREPKMKTSRQEGRESKRNSAS